MTVGDRGEPFETFVAIDVMHPPQDLLGGRTGEVAAGLADLGEQCDVLARVAARIKGRGLRAGPGASRRGHGALRCDGAARRGV